MKGENSITCYYIVLMFKLAKIQCSQRNISFLKHWIYFFLMDDDSKHKVDDSDDGWMLDSEKNWGGGV